MWIAVLNFCLFLLLLGFFFYGIRQWTSLINEPEESEKHEYIIDGHYQRLPFWILLAGFALVSLIRELTSLFGL
jgi:hypothetical protein